MTEVKIGSLVRVQPGYYSRSDCFEGYSYGLTHLEPDGKSTHTAYRSTESLFLVVSVDGERSVLAPCAWSPMDRVELPAKGLRVVSGGTAEGSM